MHVGIVTNVRSKKGLWRDAVVLDRGLVARGHSTRLIDFQHERAQAKHERTTVDALLFLEVLEPDFYPLLRPGGRMARIPNPEWESPAKIAETQRAGIAVWCKTQHALNLGPWPRKRFIGFESEEIGTVSPPPGPLHFLHPAGGSVTRGTGDVLRAWEIAMRNGLPPESWLTVSHPPINHEVGRRLGEVPRVRIVREMIEPQFRELQLRHAVHVLPSEYEGWCHLFWEALGAGARVLATDGPWWERALWAFDPIPASDAAPRMLAPRRAVSVEALAEAMVRAARQPPRLNLAGCAVFREARAEFREALAAAVVADLQPETEAQ